LTYEVAIAGAGPGGVATAAALLRADPSLRGKVVLLDRARFPRQKPCGGGLTGHADEALAALGLALDVPSFPSPRATVRFGAFAREVVLPRPVKVVRREEFDASLVAQARDLGAEVREASGMTGFSIEGASPWAWPAAASSPRACSSGPTAPAARCASASSATAAPAAARCRSGCSAPSSR
jgi:flavin-dependent dehydrogenase